jgi:hypothetical protein
MRYFYQICTVSRRVYCGAVFAALCVLAQQANGCTLDGMNRYIGQWYGQGGVQEDQDAALEAIACRVIFDSPEPGYIVTRGICATANETREVAGYLTCSDGRLSGPLLASDQDPEPRLISGRATEQETILELEGIHPNRGGALRYRLNVTFHNLDEMTMRITRGGLIALNIRYGRE